MLLTPMNRGQIKIPGVCYPNVTSLRKVGRVAPRAPPTEKKGDMFEGIRIAPAARGATRPTNLGLGNTPSAPPLWRRGSGLPLRRAPCLAGKMVSITNSFKTHHSQEIPTIPSERQALVTLVMPLRL